MKKLLLSLCTTIICTTFALGQNLVITEIMYNNPGSGTDSLEFVEIHNPSNASVNLKNFTFRTAFNDTLPDASIAAGGYYVVAFNANYFKAKFGFAPGNQWKNGALNNSGERIDLYNATGTLLDSVRYSAIAPWPTGANGLGPSLVFCDLTKDNGSAANWTVSTNLIGKLNGVDLYASPGKADCQSTVSVTANTINVNTQKNLPVTIPTNAFSTPTSATIEVTKQPSNGTFALTGTTYTYTPKANFCGTDAVEFKACIGTTCDTKGKVNITVICPTSYTKTTIADATADADNNFIPESLGNFVEVEGIVHSPNYSTSPSIQYCIIDAADKNGGITVSRNAKNFGYTPKEGDKIKVQGRIGLLSGLTIITPDSLFKTGTGTLFTATTVTKLDETTENALVEMKGLTLVTPTQWGAGGATATGFNLDAKDASGNTVLIRVDKDINDLFTSAGPKSAKFDCIGIGAQFTSAFSPNNGYQLMPRKLSDLKIYVGTNDTQLGTTVKVAPNPFQNEIRINLSENVNRIFVSDAVGRLVTFVANPTENTTINTENWTNGMYFITIEKDGRQFTTKMVK